MSHKIRVHELAKELDKDNKEILDILHKMGIEVKSHLSGLTEEQEKLFREKFGKKETVVKKETKVPKKAEKKEMKHKSVKSVKSVKPEKPEKVEEKKEPVVEEEEINIVKLPADVTIKEFAEKIEVSSADIVKKLFLKGQMLTVNSPIPFELAEEIALEHDILIEEEVEEEISFGEKFDLEIEDKPEDLKERPAVITIMGHVDHGKTSLLDAIRETEVAEGEAGGITQSIGAYQITKDGKKITFIDTPGHEAFTEMRARGSKVTDIAILVVAADDGVMPQTIEAVSHAKAANVPIIVAVNKIDKEGADPMKIKNELTEYELVPVEWGGDVEFIEVSAKQRLNLEDLLETIVLTAEILELKVNSKKRAKGVVLESRLDSKLGPVADVLLQEGTLKVGEVLVAGANNGRVRAMINDHGEKIKEAGPSMPIEIVGFSSVPEAGDVFYVMKNDKEAKKLVSKQVAERKIREQNKKKHVTLDSLHDQLEQEKLKDLKLIIKADTKGSVEALKDSLKKLSNEEVIVNIIHASTGAVTEGDVKLAEASDAIIIGFNVRPTTKARNEAERENVEVRNYNVIYRITEEIEQAIKGMLTPIFKEVYLGRIEIKKVFKITNVGNIAGCMVVDGKVIKESEIRLLRNGIIVYEGKLASLKRYQSDASEVVNGQECGLGVENYNDIKEGDIIESFIMEEIPR